MSRDIKFLYVIAIAALVFAAVNGILLVAKYGKTAKTIGTIVSVKTVYPESVKRFNSKWAKVSYKVDSRTYTSENQIQVSMWADIGDQVTVRYDKEHLEQLYSFSVWKAVFSGAVGAFCLSEATWMRR